MPVRLPEHPVSVDQLELKAKSALKTEAFDYVAGGAGSEDTMHANRDAFRRWRIVPRFLRDVSQRDLGVEVLGLKLRAPVMLAPIGVQGILHKEGELAVARAARSLGVPMILSTVSSYPMETVAAALGDTPRWFQLYWPRNDELAASFINRAEQAGLRCDRGDARHLLARLARARHPERVSAVLSRRRAGELFQRPGLSQGRGRRSASQSGAGARVLRPDLFRPSRTWDDLGRLCRSTRLPVLVKGVLHADDARRAVDQGAAGVIVSNHGGRQLDGGLAGARRLAGNRRRRRRSHDGPLRQRHQARGRCVQGDRAGSAGGPARAGPMRSAWPSAASRA